MFDYPMTASLSIPADVSASSMNAPGGPTYAPAPVSASAVAPCACGGQPYGQPAFLGMPGVDFWSFGTWPGYLKIVAGVAVVGVGYKLVMR